MDANAELAKLMRPTTAGDLADLRSVLADHVAAIEARAQERSHLEVGLARDLAASFTTLIDEGGLDDEQRSLLRAAIDYFVQPYDAEADLSSPIGLEDDAFIANTAFERLGRPDLTVSAI
ncbi:MAG: hypothetical protein KF906_09550 [Actinobacteria bacterium]|nr:hypothetical protein [Actinomycetota bacterium]